MASDAADDPLAKASQAPAYRKVKRVAPEHSPVTPADKAPDPELGQMQAQMRATAGHLTLSTRVVWPSDRLFTLHVSAGVGVYVLMIQDHLAGNTSPNDTGNASMSPGGYLGFGLDAALTRWVGVHVEGRMHAFRLGDIGLSYPGQSANAPCLELLFGLSNWSIPW